MVESLIRERRGSHEKVGYRVVDFELVWYNLELFDLDGDVVHDGHLLKVDHRDGIVGPFLVLDKVLIANVGKRKVPQEDT